MPISTKSGVCPGVSLEYLILKGQCYLGHRSNFSEFLGSIWIKFGECMDFIV